MQAAPRANTRLEVSPDVRAIIATAAGGGSPDAVASNLRIIEERQRVDLLAYLRVCEERLRNNACI